MLEFIAEVAARAGLTDYRVVVNVGPTAGQTVFHLHWHILGRRPARPDGLPHRTTEVEREPDRRIETEIKDAMLARDADAATRCA